MERSQIDEKLKSGLASIEQACNAAAAEEGKVLTAKGVTDSDAFYDAVHAAATREANPRRDSLIQELKELAENDGEYFNEISEEVVAGAAGYAELAAQAQYDELEEKMAEKRPRRKRNPGVLLMALLTLAGVLIVFCNIGANLTAQRPDPIFDQQERLNGDTTDNATRKTQISAVENASTASSINNDPNYANVSDKEALATAKGLVPAAGTAGMAGKSPTQQLSGVLYYNAACDALNAGQSDKALQSLDTAIENNADVYQYFYNRGCLHLYAVRLKEALADFDAALAVRTDLIQAHYNKGGIYLWSAGDQIEKANKAPSAKRSELLKQAAANLRAAIVEYTIVQKHMPNLSQPYYNRGIAKVRLGDLTGAELDFKHALASDAKNKAAGTNLQAVQTLIAKPDAKLGTPGDSAPIGLEGPPGPGYY